MENITSLFGSGGDLYIKMIDELCLEDIKVNYYFLGENEFEEQIRTDPKIANQTYWTEMLYRTHWASVIAIIRSRRWIWGVSSALKDQNAYAFAACLRGFLEACADTSTAFLGGPNIPNTLSDNCQRINESILGKCENISVSKELEEILIHFSFARKNTKKAEIPNSHHAKKITEYIEVIRKANVPKIDELYYYLCEFTHPSNSSIGLWSKQDSKNECEIQIVSNREGEAISWFHSEFKDSFMELLTYSFHAPLLTLRVLNSFSLSSLHTPDLNRWDFSGLKIWKGIEEGLKRLAKET